MTDSARTKAKADRYAANYGRGRSHFDWPDLNDFPQVEEAKTDDRALAYHSALRHLLPRKDAHPTYMKIRRRALTNARMGHRWAAHAAAKRIANPDELAAVEGLIYGQALQDGPNVPTQIYRARNPRR